MNLRELITGAPPQTLGLKGFAYPQQGGNGSSGGVYYAASNALMLTSPTVRDYSSVQTEFSSVLAVCLNRVSNAFPEAELCIERATAEGEYERESDHPALALIDRPNPYMHGAELLTSVARDLMTSATGSAYIVKRRTSKGRELWPVVSSMMRPVWPSEGDAFISAYELTVDGKRRYFDPADVIHFRNDIDHNPPSYGRCGIPYLPAIWQDLYIDTSAADFTAAIMRNMGLPGAIISPKALVDGRSVTLPPEVRDQFAADYQARFTGQGRGRAMITGNPIDVHQLGFDPQKMSLREIRQIVEERVSAIYGIPAIVCGFGAGLEHGSFENTDQSWRMFWNACVIPLQRRIARTLSDQLLDVDFGEQQAWFEFNYDYIPALQESETEKRQRDRDDYLAGGLTHHQYVGRLGLDPEGDDWVLLPSTVAAYPVGVIPEAPEPEPMPLALPPKPEEVPKSSARQFYKASPGAVLDVADIFRGAAITGTLMGKSDTPDRGEPLAWTDEQIEAESIITDEDIARAEEVIRERSPELADLLDSTEKSAPLETKANYRWNSRTRRYIGSNGRMVPKASVDAAMDTAVEASREVMAGYADRLIAGEWSLVDYQLAMRDEIKVMHTAGVATTRGGWARLSPRERGQAAKRIQEQYKYLDQSCRDFASGDRALDGRMRASSKMYASSARSAFGEADYDATKDALEAQADTHQERWVRHASDSCTGCVSQSGKGWVGLGELPQIGSQTCKTNCKCSKSVRRRPRE